MRLLRYLGIGFCAALALPAAAHAGPGSPHPWSDLSASGFTAPAGTRCPFTLDGTILTDDERVRTLDTFDDGTPRTQLVVGQLVMRFTNEDTGASVKRNLTGNGIFTWRADGSLERLTLQGGHFAAGFAPTHQDGPALLVFTGAGHSVSFGVDGTRTITYGSGPVENICQTLAS